MSDYTQYGYTRAQGEFAEHLLIANFNLYKEDWDDAESYEAYAENYTRMEYEATGDSWEDLTLDEALEIAKVVADDLSQERFEELAKESLERSYKNEIEDKKYTIKNLLCDAFGSGRIVQIARPSDIEAALGFVPSPEMTRISDPYKNHDSYLLDYFHHEGETYYIVHQG